MFLIRHAPHAHVDHRLSGRLPGLPLTETGARRARRLAMRLAHEPLSRIEASPLDRTMQTAQAIGAASGLPVERVEALAEIDFGAWSGLSFAELDGDEEWRFWNERRSEARAPGGESMTEAQRRIVDHLYAAAARHEEGVIAMISHCDVIRGAVAHVLGLSLDAIHRFDVAPASITEIAIDGGHARLVQLNERVH